MKKQSLPVVPVIAFWIALTSGQAVAQEVSSNLDASLRFGIGLDTEPDTEFTFNNYGSRIRWGGRADLEDGTAALGYLEFGFDQDEGVSTTRQAWVGYEADFGTVKGGKQYSALYDAIVSRVDIAWWGSCWIEYGCSRTSSTVKYESKENDGMKIHASGQLVDDDPGSDVIDEIEAGVTLQLNENLSVGFGAAYVFEDLVTDLDGTVSGNDDGFGLLAGATMIRDELTLGGMLQFIDGDAIGSDDDDIGLTLSAAQGDYYGVFALQDGDNTPFYATLGYSRPLIGEHARFYLEAQVVEPDLPDVDTELLARAVFIFDFDVFNMERPL